MKKFLLHTCCGPCAIHVAQELSNNHQVTLFFYNPNIYPKEEYERRFEEVKRWSKKANFDLIEGEYDHHKWLESVKGLENEIEGGERCIICYRLRLAETAKLAKEKGFEVFAATLTISPHKKAENINPIGQKLAQKYQLEFMAKDWKKQDGYKHARELSQEQNFYRQAYCGCEYSIRALEHGSMGA